MKKRILLTALLVVPMGIAIAWTSEAPYETVEEVVEQNTSTINTGGPEQETYSGIRPEQDIRYMTPSNQRSTITTGTLGMQATTL